MEEPSALMLFESGRGVALESYEGTAWERAKQAWLYLDSVEEDVRWHRGGIAAAISDEAIYGDASLRRFAEELGLNPTNLANMAATYRRMEALESSSRDELLALPHLSFSHYRVAKSLESDERLVEVLKQANEKRWSVERTSSYVARLNQESLPAPEERHEVLGRIGFVPEELKETMAENLDAMNEYERGVAVEAVGSFDEKATAELAGLKHVEPASREPSPEEEAAKRWDKFLEDLHKLLMATRAKGGARALVAGRPESFRRSFVGRVDQLIEDLVRIRKEANEERG